MKRLGLGVDALVGVLVPEAAGGLVVEPGAEVVLAEVGVVLLASIQVGVVAVSRAADEVAEGVVVPGVGDRAALVGQGADAAAAVVEVVAKR